MESLSGPALSQGGHAAYRPSGHNEVRAHTVESIMNISFVVTYTKTRVKPPATAIEYDRAFPTMWAALNFCVRLTALGGDALLIAQYIGDREDAALEGQPLTDAIDHQRDRLEAA